MNSNRIAAAVATVVLAALAPSGCGTQDNNTSGAGSGTTTAQTTAQVEVGNTINYSAVGTTREIDCANGKSLTVGGANNTLTIRGTCSKANIGGTDNKVTFEKIDQELDVVGMHATITYKSGTPKVTNTGSGNTINQG